MNTSIGKFLKYTTSKWDRDFPLKNIWTVYFLGLNGVVRGVSNILYNTERFYNREIWPVVDYGSEQDDNRGLYAANSVAFPDDSYKIIDSSVTNMNGLRIPKYADSRNPYDFLSITFLETNTDILDYLFRPWIIAASHKGYIEDGDPNTIIKSDVLIELYSRINPKDNNVNRNEWNVRKSFLFEGVVPVKIDGERLEYKSLDFSDFTKTVTFSFKNYQLVKHPRTKDVPGAPLFDFDVSRSSGGGIAYSFGNSLVQSAESNLSNGVPSVNPNPSIVPPLPDRQSGSTPEAQPTPQVRPTDRDYVGILNTFKDPEAPLRPSGQNILNNLVKSPEERLLDALEPSRLAP